jgi:hypothetical protein
VALDKIKYFLRNQPKFGTTARSSPTGSSSLSSTPGAMGRPRSPTTPGLTSQQWILPPMTPLLIPSTPDISATPFIGGNSGHQISMGIPLLDLDNTSDLPTTSTTSTSSSSSRSLLSSPTSSGSSSITTPGALVLPSSSPPLSSSRTPPSFSPPAPRQAETKRFETRPTPIAITKPTNGNKKEDDSTASSTTAASSTGGSTTSGTAATSANGDRRMDWSLRPPLKRLGYGEVVGALWNDRDSVINTLIDCLNIHLDRSDANDNKILTEAQQLADVYAPASRQGITTIRENFVVIPISSSSSSSFH